MNKEITITWRKDRIDSVFLRFLEDERLKWSAVWFHPVLVYKKECTPLLEVILDGLEWYLRTGKGERQ